jgi:hypothetical protein
MRIQDQRITDDGLAVHLLRSKTDQTGAGSTIGIAASPTPLPADEQTGIEPVDDERDGGEDSEGESSAVSLDAVTAWLRWRRLLG